jgi:hypothetical protein
MAMVLYFAKLGVVMKASHFLKNPFGGTTSGLVLLLLLSWGAPVWCAPITSAPTRTASPAPSAVAAETTGQHGILAANQTDEVLKLLQANVGSDVIQAYIKSSPIAYNLNASDIISLKEQGATSEIILALIQRGAELRAQSAQSSPRPAAPAPRGYSPPANTTAPAPAYTTDYSTQPVYVNYSYPYTYSYPGYNYWWYNYSYPSSYYWPYFYVGWPGYYYGAGYRYPYHNHNYGYGHYYGGYPHGGHGGYPHGGYAGGYPHGGGYGGRPNPGTSHGGYGPGGGGGGRPATMPVYNAGFSRGGNSGGRSFAVSTGGGYRSGGFSGGGARSGGFSGGGGMGRGR